MYSKSPFRVNGVQSQIIVKMRVRIDFRFEPFWKDLVRETHLSKGIFQQMSVKVEKLAIKFSAYVA